MILCTAALLIPVVAGAQWRQTGGPEGGVFRTMAGTSNGIVAVLGAEGLYRFQGGTWSKISDFTPQQLFPSGESLIAAVRGAASAIEFYRSDDQGANWEKVDLTTELDPRLSVVGESIYVVLGDTLLVSRDGLRTVETLSIVPMFMSPPVGRGDLLLAGAGFFSDSIYRSVDGGRTWAGIETNLAPGFSGRILSGGSETFYALTGNREVHRSTDGATWEPLTEGLPAEVRLDWLMANDEGAFIQVNGGAIHYLDGSVWKPIPVSGYSYTPALDGDRLLIPTNSGAYAFSTEEHSLTTLSSGLRNLPIAAIAATSEAILASGVNGLHRSMDEGESWERVGELYVWSFETHGEAVFAVAGGDILRSTDHGATWVSMQTKFDDFKIARWGTNEYPLPFTGISIADDGTLYATIASSFNEHASSGWRDGGVFRSEDNGETWSEVSGTLPHDGFTYVPVNDAIALEDGVVLISTLDGIYRSSSRGLGWSRMMGGLRTDDVMNVAGTFFVLNGSVYLQSNTGLYRTDMNAGAAWQKAPDPPIEATYWTTYGDHANIVDGKLYTSLSLWDGAGLDYFVYSFDGTTWEDVTEEMPEGVRFQTFAQKENRVFAGSQWHSVWSKSLAPSGVSEATAGTTNVSLVPNPTSGGFTVRLNLERSADDATISMMNLLGERVAVLHSGALSAGEKVYRFDGHELPAGVYVVRVVVDEERTEQLIVRQ